MSYTGHPDASRRHAPVLTDAILARIHELNRDYLEVLLTEPRPAAGVMRLGHLPASQLDKLATLSAAARAALAACPYTLYSLGFENSRFWEELGEQWDARPADSRYAVACTAPLLSPFCEVALFLAWHVATSNFLAAGMLYAMPERVARALAARPLWWLRCVAADHPDLMAPRWPANRCFWPNLIRAAACGEVRRLETTRLLGTQLIAAELAGHIANAQRKHMLLGARTPR